MWDIKSDDLREVSKEGISRTIEYFSSLSMPVSLHELGVEPSDEEIHSLALNATMNGAVKLSAIKPLGADEGERILKRAK